MTALERADEGHLRMLLARDGVRGDQLEAIAGELSQDLDRRREVVRTLEIIGKHLPTR